MMMMMMMMMIITMITTPLFQAPGSIAVVGHQTLAQRVGWSFNFEMNGYGEWGVILYEEKYIIITDGE